jgi:alpha-tubulin suppressor-like RCC1 family protein
VSQKYPGGIISKTAPVTVGPVDGEGGSAPGVWTLTQALELNKQGLWPKPVLQRELYAWFSGSYGKTGLNNTTTYSSPVQVGSDIDWYQVFNGNYHSHAIKTNGTLWAWGRNNYGQLGQNDVVNRSSPVQVGALTTWSHGAAGKFFTAAIKTDGTMWAWGRNEAGQLGQNDVVNRSSPVQVGALTTWSKLSCLKNSGAVFAIKTDGTMWTWGYAGSGVSGLNAVVSHSSPVQIGALTNWSQVSAGSDHCMAVKTDGTMWSWGYRTFGRLGVNDVYNRSSPTQVGALTNWSQVSGGANFSAAVKTDGTMWSWGRAYSGQLGLNLDTFVDRSSPMQIGALTNWSEVTAAVTSCFAIKTDGTLWAWGLNNGKLGSDIPYNRARSSPVQVGALTTWFQITGNGGVLAITKG